MKNAGRRFFYIRPQPSLTDKLSSEAGEGGWWTKELLKERLKADINIV